MHQDNVKARNKALSTRIYAISFAIFVYKSSTINIKYAITDFYYLQTSNDNNGISFCKVSAKQ